MSCPADLPSPLFVFVGEVACGENGRRCNCGWDVLTEGHKRLEANVRNLKEQTYRMRWAMQTNHHIGHGGDQGYMAGPVSDGHQ